MLGLGGPEMIWIFVILLLLFGAKKLPQLARGIGEGLGEFKKARDEFEREIKNAEHDVKEEPRLQKPREPRLDVGTTAAVEKKEDHHEEKAI